MSRVWCVGVWFTIKFHGFEINFLDLMCWEARTLGQGWFEQLLGGFQEVGHAHFVDWARP